LSPHFFTFVKQQGARLAKGRLLGVQFEAFFEDGLYERIGRPAIAHAHEISHAFEDAGIALAHPTETNQVFPILSNSQAKRLGEVALASFREKPDEHHTIVCLATSRATKDEDAEALVRVLGSGILAQQHGPERSLRAVQSFLSEDALEEVHDAVPPRRACLRALRAGCGIRSRLGRSRCVFGIACL
jgi:hypothetical protein